MGLILAEKSGIVLLRRNCEGEILCFFFISISNHNIFNSG